MVEQHHNYTALLLLVAAIMILAGAIFLTIAYNRVRSNPQFSRLEELDSAKSYLYWAFILGYIAAGIGMILAFIYFGHIAIGVTNETIHFIVFFLLFALVIVSGILGFIALSKINNNLVLDKNGAPGWIWAAEVVGLIALIIIIVSGAWRAQHYATNVVGKTVVNSDGTPVVSTSTTTTTTAPAYPAPVDVDNPAPVYATVTERIPVAPLPLPQPFSVTHNYVPSGSSVQSVQSVQGMPGITYSAVPGTNYIAGPNTSYVSGNSYIPGYTSVSSPVLPLPSVSIPGNTVSYKV